MGLIPGAILSAGVLLAVAIVALLAVRGLIVIVPPNMASVITGRTRTRSDGTVVGYRAVIGSRTLRIPIIESVEWMSLETIPIEITVDNAFSKGNIPLRVEAIANVKIASHPEAVFSNAVERLLDKSEAEIKAMARDTLMGNLRGVVATLTPEEVNEDRLEFARALSDEAGEDLASLGFQLDVLKIQNVSDATGYLEAIGREKAAEAIRDAEIAEADAEAATRERQAEAKQRAEIKEAAAEIEIAEARNRLRVRQAQLDREGETAERVARVRAMEAEVEAQRLLEAKRVEREQERLRADVIAPAEAEKKAAQARAEAEAAPLRERGRAQAEVLEMLYARIQEGGAAGLPVLTLEKLPELLGISVAAIEGVDIDRLVVIDGGDGDGVASAANSRLRGALATLEGLSQALGLDLEGLLRKVGGDGVERAAVEPAAREEVVSESSG